MDRILLAVVVFCAAISLSGITYLRTVIGAPSMPTMEWRAAAWSRSG